MARAVAALGEGQGVDSMSQAYDPGIRLAHRHEGKSSGFA